MIQILANVTCGPITIDEIVPSVISTAVDIIKVGIPVALIIFGMLDLGKAVMTNDEKEMKSAQSKFIKRCIYAILVFFIVAIVQFVVSVLNKASNNTLNGATNEGDITDCIDCFVNGTCD